MIIPISHQKRYRTWSDAMRDAMAAVSAVEGARTPKAKAMARVQLKAVAERPDGLTVPEGWRSWEELGDAMHGRKAPRGESLLAS